VVLLGIRRRQREVTHEERNWRAYGVRRRRRDVYAFAAGRAKPPGRVEVLWTVIV